TSNSWFGLLGINYTPVLPSSMTMQEEPISTSSETPSSVHLISTSPPLAASPIFGSGERLYVQTALAAAEPVGSSRTSDSSHLLDQHESGGTSASRSNTE